jgi:amidase
LSPIPEYSDSRAVTVLSCSALFLCLALSVPASAQQVAPPPLPHPEATLGELQEALRTGSLSSVALVDYSLARIDALDQNGPRLNAIIAVNPAARAEAARLDEERASGRIRGPLHGIPVVVKDNYDVFGMPTTGASIALREHRPIGDATQIRRLREAGAIILAKTNLHELAYGITTISSLGGQTLNPYDRSRNPGGSSGGTAAAVAAGYAPLGWGSDTCGSIRIPASANNLFGLRPTKGLSSIDGILPLSATQDVGGPLARTVRDLAIGLDATVGYDPADPATEPIRGRQLRSFVDALDADALRGARIGVLTTLFGDTAEEAEVNSLVRGALDRMVAIGAEVVDVEIPGLQELLAGTSTIDLEFKSDLAAYLERSPSPPVESLRTIVERELHHQAVAGVLRRSDRHETRPSAEIEEAMRRRALARAALIRFMDEHRLDALAYPSLRREPARIGEAALGNNCQLSATTATPALAIPAGFTSGGVPIGFELLGRPFDDARLVSFGYAFEQAVRPRRPPSLDTAP